MLTKQPPGWIWVPLGFAALIVLAGLYVHRHEHPAPEVDLTSEERAWLTANPSQLRLYYNTDFPPIEFASPDGQFIGLGSDVIAEVERLLDVTFIKLPCEDWNRHLEALESGECAIAPTIVRTTEREHYASFTTPYAVAPVVIITTRDQKGDLTLDGLSGCRVAVVSGFATEGYVREHANGHFTVVPVHTVREGLLALAFRDVDAFVENVAVAAYYIEREGIPNLRVAGQTDYAFAWSIGVSREYPLLFSSIEKALAAIPEDQLAVIRRRWVSLSFGGGLSPETVLSLKLGGGFLGLLILSLTTITVVLKRRLNEKVASLYQSQRELLDQQEALLQSEAMFREAVATLPLGCVIATVGGTVRHVNQTFTEMLGYTQEDIPDTEAWFQAAYPDENYRRLVFEDWGRHLETAGGRTRATPARVFDVTAKDGRVRTIEFRASAVGGRLLILLNDITERRQAEEERAQLHAQLAQSQRLESVGRLAGGIAHDFNNMLGVILGHAELALGRIRANQPPTAHLERIHEAAQRSANLTRQLLALARQQTIAPRALDLNATISGTADMLRRLIGEDIVLHVSLSPDLWPVHVDPGQLDQVLTNLCVNARDAIEHQGVVTIETRNAVLDADYCSTHPGATEGDYVALIVRDDGCGMDASVRDRIFEPFFTTKETGKGTGLGLATVFGIVTQNGGYVDVVSAPGAGAEFSVYLPRHLGGDVSADADAEGLSLARRGATVLLVEDESLLREVTDSMLRQLGYDAIVAARPQEALELAAERPGKIDLLLTDVIMPEMNGRTLAERLRLTAPGLRCLFMSGYPADVIASRGIIDPGVHFLQKPFAITELAAKIEEALDAEA